MAAARVEHASIFDQPLHDLKSLLLPGLHTVTLSDPPDPQHLEHRMRPLLQVPERRWLKLRKS